jgi:hypothetical protein
MTKPVLAREISKRKGTTRKFRFFIYFSNEADVQGQLTKQPLLITLTFGKILREKI